MSDPLLDPLTINKMTLKNRIFVSAHAPAGYVTAGRPGLRYALYVEEKAKGGIGLTMFGGSSYVSSDSTSHFGSIDASDDYIIPFFRDVAQRVHNHGSKAIVQITHLGRRGDDHAGDWLPTVSPSAIRERAHRSYPKQLEEFDFDRITGDYVAAALRAQKGGLDGVEIAGLGGHLIDQFLAPRSNTREDEFGGSLENRVRFPLQVIAAVRAAVGPDFVVGLRYSGDENTQGGIGPDESVEIAKLVTTAGHLDFLSITFGGGFTHQELSDIMPPFGRELGAHLPTAARIRAAVNVPVMHAGRIADLATARHALREDLVDLVGMTRASIADPHLVSKLERGEEERIRPCVGASFCLTGSTTYCIHNVSTSREEFIPQLTTPGSEKLRIVIVGGGPGGLEAARVSAERGHHVTLFEAGAQLGGQVLMMSRPHRQSEKRSITEWLATEARLAGATLKTGKYVDGDDVAALNPDVVIVATGGMPDTELPGGGERFVSSVSDLLGRAAPSGRSVLVYDAHGGDAALTALDHLLPAGNRVEFVTVDEAVGHDVGHTVRPDYMKLMYEGGTVVTTDHQLESVVREGSQLRATLVNTYTKASTTRLVDDVIVEQGTIAISEVYDELRDRSTNRGQIDLAAFATGQPQTVQTNPSGEFKLFRIGDAVSHRGVHSAIYDARRLCMNL